MDCSTPGFLVLHYLPEFAQIHVHWVGDAIQPSHPLPLPSPPALNQGLFQWVGKVCLPSRWHTFCRSLHSGLDGPRGQVCVGSQSTAGVSSSKKLSACPPTINQAFHINYPASPRTLQNHQQPHHPKLTTVTNLLAVLASVLSFERNEELGWKAISLHSPPQSQSFSSSPGQPLLWIWTESSAHFYLLLPIYSWAMCTGLFSLQNFHQGFTINTLLQFAFFPHCTLFSAFLWERKQL